MAEIKVEKLHKAFGDFVAVRDSNFTVENERELAKPPKVDFNPKK